MNLPKRKSTRLKDYDYSTPGSYFITICTEQKQHLFGEIKNGKMQLNDFGELVNLKINEIESHYTNIRIDKYVVMPNHIHMIITILDIDAEELTGSHSIKNDIPNVVGKFKAGVTRSAKDVFIHNGKKSIWQTSCNDHIIRGEKDYEEIWEYIDTNVIRWNKQITR